MISVLLPVYDAELFLADAVDSILQQTYQDFELLALDDGSMDKSLKILKEFEAKDSRVRVISRKNKGLVVTLNELVSLSSGRYLARMDADDVCLPDRFNKQVAFLDANSEYAVVGGWVEQINSRGQPIGVLKTPKIHEDINDSNLKGHVSICHPCAMIRRKAMVAANGYKPEFEDAEDIDLWLRIAEIGKLANLQEVLIRYRLHENSISEKKGASQQKAIRNACEQAWRRRKINGHYEANDHWRPDNSTKSRHSFALKYGWVSWSNGHRGTWWTYVRKAFLLKPFALSSWKLLVFGLLKSPPSQQD